MTSLCFLFCRIVPAPSPWNVGSNEFYFCFVFLDFSLSILKKCLFQGHLVNYHGYFVCLVRSNNLLCKTVLEFKAAGELKLFFYQSPYFLNILQIDIIAQTCLKNKLVQFFNMPAKC